MFHSDCLPIYFLFLLKIVSKVVYHDFVMIHKNFLMILNTHTRKVIVSMQCKHYKMQKKVNYINTFLVRVFEIKINLGTSLPRYYSYYPHFEAARERHIFVPKHFPNENPSTYDHKGLQHFKEVDEHIDFVLSKQSINCLASRKYRKLCTSKC